MIGVFDSGLGGLSAFLPLTKLMPQADLCYYADTAALPLGERKDPEILARISTALAFFDDLGVTGVLLACGTASSLLTEECKEKFSFPILDIITPTTHAARSLKVGSHILLLATEAATRKGQFAAALARMGHSVSSLACPALVRIAEGNAAKGESVAEALLPAHAAVPDAIVLGCTHFSLLKQEIAALYPHTRLIDAAACGASAACARFHSEGEGKRRFFVTGDPILFSAKAEKTLGFSVKAEKIRS